jgi:DNA-binding NarL/FixJ family response regulator
MCGENPMSTTVLLADDSEIMRKAIMYFLKDDSDIEVLAEGANFAQTMLLAIKLQPHVILLDLHMNDERTVTPSQVKASLNGSRLIAMSIWKDDETKSLAETYGALTLLDKATLGSELIATIKRYANPSLPS